MQSSCFSKYMMCLQLCTRKVRSKASAPQPLLVTSYYRQQRFPSNCMQGPFKGFCRC